MQNLTADIHFGLRMLLRNKGFSAIAMLVLALGIGPNVAIFSIVYATFLAPMPYPEPDRMVVLWNMVKGERAPMPVDEFLELQAQAQSFSYLGFGSWTTSAHIRDSDHIPDAVGGMAVTPGDITTNTGLRMALGRDILPSEGVPGNDREIILTHKTWQERYHSDPSIVGKSIPVNDLPYTVIGVIAPGMGDRIPMPYYVPTAFQPEGHNQNQWGGASGRLKPGVTLAQAQAELSILDQRYLKTHSNDVPKGGWSLSVEPLHNVYLDKNLARNLWLLLAGVGFVLLIACSNLANLLLARGASRQQEIAVRTALGASSGRIFTQLIVESLTLAIAGGAAGILLGWAMMKCAMALLPADYGLQSEALVEMNLPVLCFAVAATILAGAISGCIPAWHSTRLNLSEMLKQGSRSVTSRSGRRIQAMLVIAEFALALTLLAGAGMALHSFWNLTHVDLGFRTDHILTGWLQAPSRDPSQTQPDSDQTNPEEVAARNTASKHAMLEKLASMPGVQSVALASNTPLEGHESFSFTMAGRPVTGTNKPVADLEAVTPGYFDTFGVQLIQGRLLNESDRAGSSNAVVVNQSFVNRYLQGVDPLDQRLILPVWMPGDKTASRASWQIVGVVRDVLNGQHLTDQTFPEIFAPYWQLPLSWGKLAVRTALDPALEAHNLRVTLSEAMPGYTLEDTHILQQTVDAQLSPRRFGTVLFAGFAALALLLAALGIYGVMSFAVAQRTAEIGVRMALGAQRSDVVRMILIDGLRLALIGIGIGLIGVFILGRVMQSTLFGVGSIDAGSFAAVSVVLLGVAVLASYLPARRSAKIDPIVALRQE